MSVTEAAIAKPLYSDYSGEQKAEAIARIDANGGNVLLTSRELGIPEPTLRYWNNSREQFRHLCEQKRIALADLAESNAYKLGLAVQNYDLTDVPLGQIATTFGVMVDKMQLLRGQPTDISLNVEGVELTVVLQDALADVIDVSPAE